MENIDADEDFRIRAAIEVPELRPGKYQIRVADRGNVGYPMLSLRIVD